MSDASRGRWVVVDVETSGLDADRDRLLAVAALAVRDGAVDLADSFEAVLRQESASSHENIEVHGIAAGEQLAGEEPREALGRFLAFAGDDPLVAYHAPFDERILTRAIRQWLGRRWRKRWLDLAKVAPLAWPGRVDARSGLDGWLEALDIPMTQRHRAIVDCLGTAQLFVALLERAPALGARDAGALLRLSSHHRWLGI